MPRFAHNPETGEVIIYDDQIGSWRTANRAEIDIEQAGVAGQVEAAVEGATGVQALMGMALRSPEMLERSAALTGSNTGAAVAGSLTTLGVGGMIGRGGSIAARTQQQIARGATEEVAEGGAFRTAQGFIRQPEDMVPGAAQGATRMVRAGLESNPVTRMVTDHLIRNPNQRNMNRLAARAVGITDEEFAAAGSRLTDDLMGIADERIGSQFDTVGDRITAAIDPDEVTKQALKLNQQNYISNAKLAQVADDTERAGRNLMDLRSQLSKRWRSERDAGLRVEIENAIDEIDKIIERAVGDDEVTKRLYQDARARYRASLALDKGVARSAEDNINVPSLNTALKSIYGTGITKGKMPRGAPQEVQDFIMGAREARGVNVGVPSSGTAERLIAANILGIGTGATF